MFHYFIDKSGNPLRVSDGFQQRYIDKGYTPATYEDFVAKSDVEVVNGKKVDPSWGELDVAGEPKAKE